MSTFEGGGRSVVGESIDEGGGGPEPNADGRFKVVYSVVRWTAMFSYELASNGASKRDVRLFSITTGVLTSGALIGIKGLAAANAVVASPRKLTERVGAVSSMMISMSYAGFKVLHWDRVRVTWLV